MPRTFTDNDEARAYFDGLNRYRSEHRSEPRHEGYRAALWFGVSWAEYEYGIAVDVASYEAACIVNAYAEGFADGWQEKEAAQARADAKAAAERPCADCGECEGYDDWDFGPVGVRLCATCYGERRRGSRVPPEYLS